MASIPFAISSLTLLIFLISLFPSSTLSQDPNSSIPTVAQCAPRLLPLATCAPFVQGTAPSPAQSCCDNLILVYSQQPSCLCLLLNGTTLSSFPINTTLALQLPALCTLPVDASACLSKRTLHFATQKGNLRQFWVQSFHYYLCGFAAGAQVPPSSPSSQVSFGANNSTVTNSTVACMQYYPSLKFFS